jgi:hypothetical protein
MKCLTCAFSQIKVIIKHLGGLDGSAVKRGEDNFVFNIDKVISDVAKLSLRFRKATTDTSSNHYFYLLVVDFVEAGVASSTSFQHRFKVFLL